MVHKLEIQGRSKISSDADAGAGAAAVAAAASAETTVKTLVETAPIAAVSVCQL